MASNIEIKIDPEFQGPTLQELLPVLEDIQGSIDLRWENGKHELNLLEQRPKVKFILHVKDISVMERTAVALGTALPFELGTVETAKLALNSRTQQKWRPMVEDMGYGAARSLLLKLTADALRAGKRPRLVASITNDCLFTGVSPLDADILLRLRSMQSH